MNKKMLWALWPCLVMTFLSHAQRVVSDTIDITPFPGSKVLLIGPHIKKLVDENNFEVLKNQFINDMKVAAKDKDFPTDPQEVIYLISADGRRRLKAKPEELSPFDVQKEIELFSAKLPPVHYTIYDLGKQFEYHIFLSDADQLEQLAAINFSTAINTIKSKESSIEKYVRIELEQENTDWKVQPVPVRKPTVMELSTNFGVGLFNSTLSPLLGVQADFVFLNKHRLPKYKIGTGVSLFALGEYQNLQFRNVNLAASIDLRPMINLSVSNNPAWFGFIFGRIRSGSGDSATIKPSLTNRYKIGLSVERGAIGIDYSFLPATRTEPSLRNLTFRFRF